MVEWVCIASLIEWEFWLIVSVWRELEGELIVRLFFECCLQSDNFHLRESIFSTLFQCLVVLRRKHFEHAYLCEKSLQKLCVTVVLRHANICNWRSFKTKQASTVSLWTIKRQKPWTIRQTLKQSRQSTEPHSPQNNRNNMHDLNNNLNNLNAVIGPHMRDCSCCIATMCESLSCHFLGFQMIFSHHAGAGEGHGAACTGPEKIWWTKLTKKNILARVNFEVTVIQNGEQDTRAKEKSRGRRAQHWFIPTLMSISKTYTTLSVTILHKSKPCSWTKEMVPSSPTRMCPFSSPTSLTFHP